MAVTLRVAGAGVLNLATRTVTHVFNPFAFQPRRKSLQVAGTGAARADMAWSSDGSALYIVLPQTAPEVALEAAGTAAGVLQVGEGYGGCCGGELGGWGHFRSVTDGDAERRSLLCALDMSEKSALCCTAVRDWGSDGDAAPFSLEWRRGRPPNSADGDTDEEEDSSVFARFVDRTAAKASEGEAGEDDGGAQASMRRLRLARWPGGLESGVAMLRETVERGSSLCWDRFDDTLLVCGRSELRAVTSA